MYYTMIKHSGHLRTLEKGRNHSPAACVFYISLVFSNARRVLSQCNTRLRLLYLLNKNKNKSYLKQKRNNCMLSQAMNPYDFLFFSFSFLLRNCLKLQSNNIESRLIWGSGKVNKLLTHSDHVEILVAMDNKAPQAPGLLTPSVNF